MSRVRSHQRQPLRSNLSFKNKKGLVLFTAQICQEKHDSFHVTSWILCAARCSVTAPLEDDHDTNTLTLTAAPPRQCVPVNSEHVYGRSWDRFVLTVKEFKEFSCWLENKGDIFWVFLFFFRTKL